MPEWCSIDDRHFVFGVSQDLRPGDSQSPAALALPERMADLMKASSREDRHLLFHKPYVPKKCSRIPSHHLVAHDAVRRKRGLAQPKPRFMEDFEGIGHGRRIGGEVVIGQPDRVVIQDPRVGSQEPVEPGVFQTFRVIVEIRLVLPSSGRVPVIGYEEIEILLGRMGKPAGVKGVVPRPRNGEVPYGPPPLPLCASPFTKTRPLCLHEASVRCSLLRLCSVAS